MKEYPVFTSKFGIDPEPGSNHTPEGRFRIAHKYGHGAEPGTIFKKRETIGLWDAQPAEEDYVQAAFCGWKVCRDKLPPAGPGWGGWRAHLRG